MSSSSVERPLPSPWRHVGADGSITLAIHVQASAKRSEVAGVHGGTLKVRLAAPAVDGKANAALIALLTDAFGVPGRAVTLVRGARSRRKIVRITGPRLRPDRTWGE